MTWQPLTHSDQTDLGQAVPVPYDQAHAPLQFELSDDDRAAAAAARRHRQAELARLNTRKGADTK
jgi:hypothetical protein